MALYRNIGYIPPDTSYQGGSMGLALFDGSTSLLATESPGSTFSLPGATQIQNSIDTYWQQQNDRYDHAMAVSLDALHQEGIFVTTDNGSLFISPTPPWTGGVPDYSRAWLPLQDIQQIENERGTAGALLLHLQEPALAKDTAGHDSGSSTTWSGSTGTASTPIPEVQSLPPVTTAPDGGVVFQPTTADTTSIPTTTSENPLLVPTTTSTTTTLPVMQPASKLTEWLPLATLAGAAFLMITGDAVVHRPKLFFAGGMGLLYYLLATQKPQTT
jgi:hypothetical protein